MMHGYLSLASRRYVLYSVFLDLRKHSCDINLFSLALKERFITARVKVLLISLNPEWVGYFVNPICAFFCKSKL